MKHYFWFSQFQGGQAEVYDTDSGEFYAMTDFLINDTPGFDIEGGGQPIVASQFVSAVESHILRFPECDYVMLKAKVITLAGSVERTIDCRLQTPGSVGAFWRQELKGYKKQLAVLKGVDNTLYAVNALKISSISDSAEGIVIAFTSGRTLQIAVQDVTSAVDYLNFAIMTGDKYKAREGKTIRYVNPDETEEGTMFNTIQAAIDASASGDWIEVSAGEYANIVHKNGVILHCAADTFINNESNTSAEPVNIPDGATCYILGEAVIESVTESGIIPAIDSLGGKLFCEANALLNEYGMAYSGISSAILKVGYIGNEADEYVMEIEMEEGYFVCETDEITSRGFGILIQGGLEPNEYRFVNADIRTNRESLTISDNDAAQAISVEGSSLAVVMPGALAVIDSSVGDSDLSIHEVHIVDSVLNNWQGQYSVAASTDNRMRITLTGDAAFGQGIREMGMTEVPVTDLGEFNVDNPGDVIRADILYLAQPDRAVLDEAESDIPEPEIWKDAIVKAAKQILENNLQM